MAAMGLSTCWRRTSLTFGLAHHPTAGLAVRLLANVACNLLCAWRGFTQGSPCTTSSHQWHFTLFMLLAAVSWWLSWCDAASTTQDSVTLNLPAKAVLAFFSPHSDPLLLLPSFPAATAASSACLCCRMIVLLHAYNLGFSAWQVAIMFTLYELAGVVTNLLAGLMGARWGIKATLLTGEPDTTRGGGHNPRKGGGGGEPDTTLGGGGQCESTAALCTVSPTHRCAHRCCLCRESTTAPGLGC
jgi:hypothetical protein